MLFICADEMRQETNGHQSKTAEKKFFDLITILQTRLIRLFFESFILICFYLIFFLSLSLVCFSLRFDVFFDLFQMV